MRAMPRRARWWGGSSDRSSPSRTTLPQVVSCRPVMTLNVVVLPAPFGPISPVMRPASTSRSTSRTAWLPPKWTLTPERLEQRASGRGRDALARAGGGARWPSPAELEHLDPAEVAVDRVVDVDADAAVQVLGGVGDAVAAVGAQNLAMWSSSSAGSPSASRHAAWIAVSRTPWVSM